jgi:hypothetical protein
LDLNRPLFISGVILFGLGIIAWYLGDYYNSRIEYWIYWPEIYVLAQYALIAGPIIAIMGVIISVISLALPSKKTPPPQQVDVKDQIKYCRYCGTANPIDNDYCKKCGKKI